MGQNHSSNRESLRSTNSKSRYRPHSNNTGFCNLGAIGPLCFNYSHERRSSTDYNVLWKEHLLEQLKSFEDEAWPPLLVAFLENNNTEANDVVFQSEFFWADFNSAKKPVHYSSKALTLNNKPRKSESFHHSINHPEEDPIFHHHHYAADDADKVNPNDPAEKKDFTQDIKNMIAASEILEERVFNLTDNQNQNWIQQSFNIRPNENDIKSRRESIEPGRISNSFFGNKGLDQVPFPKGRNTILEEPQHNQRQTVVRADKNVTGSMRSIRSVDSSAFPDTRSINSFERYENNTFIVQQQPDKNSSKMGSPSGRASNAINGNGAPLSEEEKLYKAVMNYKTLTGIIDSHLRQKNNTFCCLIETFETYYENSYGSVSKKVKEGSLLLSEVNTYISNATKDLQQFIRIMWEGVSLFYKLDKIKVGREMSQGTLFNRDNILNFITSIIFTKKIHDTIFKLYQIQSLPIEETYEKSLKRCQNLGPQDFGVPEEFCLNEKTVQYIKNSMKSMPNSQSINKVVEKLLGESPPEDEIIEMVDSTEETKKEKDQPDNNNGNNKPKSQISGVNNKDNKDKEVHNNKPYSKAVETLKMLEHRKSPLHKLKTIVKVAENMSISIQEFYKEQGTENMKKLDADQTLMVLMYILARSGLNDVTTHCKIIENFTTNNVLDSVSGYYATTLEACVNCICSISLEKTATEDATSPASGEFNQFYHSMPSWNGGKQMHDASSLS